MNVWAVHISMGFNQTEDVALKYKYTNLGPINGLKDYYIFRKEVHPRRSRRHAQQYTNELLNDQRVHWAEQQTSRIRSKRGFTEEDSQWLKFLRSSDALERGEKYPFPYEDHTFNDELWTRQWYLHDTRNVPTLPKLDLGVKEAWKMGYTGKGIVVSVLDDGLEWNHTDIKHNFDQKASCDANDNDWDPTPHYDRSDSNSHGTRCAGEIAMTAHNHKCGVGIAFNARIGGIIRIRCLDGEVSDVVEAQSLGFNNHYIDIYSSSWGPNDDGITLDGPKKLATDALLKGILYGRKGKGCIYVWASGNGGLKGDNCNCDGYASSIYTLSVGSASQSGRFPYYSERCASTLAVTYSSGSYTDQRIATTDLHDKCTIEHTGTSAAAPLAAGIIALVLEANPNLTWRDVQHLVVCTAQFSPLMENKSWKRNAAGFMYNSRFGFGLMKADLLIKAALKWTTVPPKLICHIKPKSRLPIPVSSGNDVQVNFLNIGHKCAVNFVEHIQLNVNIEYSRRGNLQLILISPRGTLSMLLTIRPKDAYITGFKNWNFTSVHFWGEDPKGHWRLVVRDPSNDGEKGKVLSATLIIHGTVVPAGCLLYGPRRYQDEDLISRTIDRNPEFLEDHRHQNKTSNELKPLRNPLIDPFIFNNIIDNPYE